jgi:hypothetical protein
MTWRAISARPVARHVSSTRVHPRSLSNVASDDVAGNICQALGVGAGAMRSDTGAGASATTTTFTTFGTTNRGMPGSKMGAGGKAGAKVGRCRLTV